MNTPKQILKKIIVAAFLCSPLSFVFAGNPPLFPTDITLNDKGEILITVCKLQIKIGYCSRFENPISITLQLLLHCLFHYGQCRSRQKGKRTIHLQLFSL